MTAWEETRGDLRQTIRRRRLVMGGALPLSGGCVGSLLDDRIIVSVLSMKKEALMHCLHERPNAGSNRLVVLVPSSWMRVVAWFNITKGT